MVKGAVPSVAVLWAAAIAGSVWAQGAVPTEVTRTASASITLHLHPFLGEEDLMILRQIAASPDALEALLGAAGGFAAIAVAPAEGFIANGMPSESAVALAQLPDAGTARNEATAACDAIRSDPQPCVIVLEVAPND